MQLKTGNSGQCSYRQCSCCCCDTAHKKNTVWYFTHNIFMTLNFYLSLWKASGSISTGVCFLPCGQIFSGNLKNIGHARTFCLLNAQPKILSKVTEPNGEIPDFVWYWASLAISLLLKSNKMCEYIFFKRYLWTFVNTCWWFVVTGRFHSWFLASQ